MDGRDVEQFIIADVSMNFFDGNFGVGNAADLLPVT